MSKAYFGSKISPHMVKTPESYLVCLSVPIARTGWQEYAEREIVKDSYSDQMVQVYRPEEEVFSPAAMASFEGKTVSDGHPAEWITATNEQSYHRGHLQNVRRGGNGDGGVLVADLFIKDSGLINRIEHGLREVSCGYDCDYEPEGGEGGKNRYVQRNIRGNHVAIVQNGRAGDRIAIRDSAPEAVKKSSDGRGEKSTGELKRSQSMNVNWRTILGLGLKEYARDAEPEKVAEAFEMAGPGAEKMPEEMKKDTKALDQGPDMMAMLERILGVLEQLVQTDKGVHAKLEGQEAPAPKPEAPPEDSLDALVSELEGKAKGGEEQFAPPEEENPEEEFAEDADVIEPVETLGAGEIPKNPIPGADTAARIRAIKAMKPVIAAMKDPVERKRATDALVAEFRKAKPPAKTEPRGYAGMLRPTKAEDKKALAQRDADLNYGDMMKEKYHRKPVLVR